MHISLLFLHVPVEEVRGGMVFHITVGDEAHVGVLGSDCCEEGYVVLHIPGLPTILQMQWGYGQHSKLPRLASTD